MNERIKQLFDRLGNLSAAPYDRKKAYTFRFPEILVELARETAEENKQNLTEFVAAAIHAAIEADTGAKIREARRAEKREG